MCQMKMRGLAVLMGITLLFTGCQSTQDKQANVAMGRYLEEKIKLEGVEEGKQPNSFLFENEEGNLEMITEEYREKGNTYQCYSPDKDGVWKKTNAALSQAIEEKKFITIDTIQKDKQTNKVYLVGIKEEKVELDEEDNEHSPYIDYYYVERIKEDGTLEEIPVEWREKEDGHYSKIIVSNDRLFVLNYDYGRGGDRQRESVIEQYDLTTGKFVSEIGENIWDFIVLKDKIIAFSDQDKDQIVFYDIKTNKLTQNIQTNIKRYSCEMCTAKDEKGVYFVCEEGVYYLGENEEVMEQIIDGKRYSLSTSSQMDTMIKDAYFHEGVFYVGFGANGNYTYKRYVYHKELPMEPEQTLTIFSLQECAPLKRAAQIYMERHPEAYVEINTIPLDRGEELEGEKMDQAINGINTKILAGEVPDIIVLDGLPIESYIEKGILGDMTSILEEIQKNGSYYDNLMRTYEKDQKLYALPMSFNILSAVGEKELIKDGFCLESLASYQKEHLDKQVLGNMPPEQLLEVMSSFWNEKLIDKDGKIDNVALKTFLESINILAPMREGATSCYQDVYALQGTRTIQAVNKEIKTTIENLPNTEQLQVMLHAKVQWEEGMVAPNIEGEEGMVRLNQLVGINAKSDQMEAIRELLVIAYSKEVTNKDFYSFQLDTEFNEKLISGEQEENIGLADSTYKIKDWGISFGVYNDKGDMDIVDYNTWHGDETQYYIDHLINAKAVKPMDSKILSIIQKGSEGYFEGKQSVDEAIDEIIKKANIYLSEQSKNNR